MGCDLFLTCRLGKKGGCFLRICCLFFLGKFFSFLAFWLLGFLAFRHLVGLALAFRILCIPSSSPPPVWLWLFASSVFASAFPGFLAFAPFHWFLASSSLFESSLLRTLWEGFQLHPYVNHHFLDSSNIRGGRAAASPPTSPPPRYFLRFNCTFSSIQFRENML